MQHPNPQHRGSPRHRRHGGARLRRAMFTTRTVPTETATATMQLVCVGRCFQWAATRGETIDALPGWATEETSPYPDKPGSGGRRRWESRSGCEHGPTLTSSVVAGLAGRTPAITRRRWMILPFETRAPIAARCASPGSVPARPNDIRSGSRRSQESLYAALTVQKI
jgi:hypothetical protein